MLIRTQRKDRLLFLENMTFLSIDPMSFYNEKDPRHIIYANYDDGSVNRKIALGTYTDRDMCMDVMENLCYCYENGCLSYQMPEVLEE